MTRRHGSLAAAVAAGSLVLLALAGCGSGGADDGIASAGGPARGSATAAGEAPAADPDERRLQLTRCLREHGVDVGDPDPNTGRPTGGGLAKADPATREAALKACARYITGGNGAAALSPEQKQQFLTYIQCLRGEGVGIADPDPATGRPQQRDFGKFLNPDQQMKAAMKACEQARPNGLGQRGNR